MLQCSYNGHDILKHDDVYDTVMSLLDLDDCELARVRPDVAVALIVDVLKKGNRPLICISKCDGWIDRYTSIVLSQVNAGSYLDSDDTRVKLSNAIREHILRAPETVIHRLELLSNVALASCLCPLVCVDHHLVLMLDNVCT